MDLELYFRVLWRFRIVVLIGLSLALGLMFLSMMRVSFEGGTPKFEYRESEQWASDVTLLVTQPGFPLGRSILDDVVPVNPGEDASPPASGDSDAPPSFVPRYGDPSRFSNLAVVYAHLATSDEVLRLAHPLGRIPGVVTASAMINQDSGGVLPIVLIRGTATTPQTAVGLAERAGAALRGYIQREQAANGIPRDRRVDLEYINHAQPPVLMMPRSKTRPMFTFLAVLVATVGLVFVLESFRPRVRPRVAEEPTALTPSQTSRRSA
jgi:hypothetical protein